MKSVIIIPVVCACLAAFTINKWRKENKDMAVIYASLIIKGTRTFESVPATIKPQVRQILIDLELTELIEENA